jgi:S1-C subfamily serine protease
MEDNILLQAIERYLDGDMLPAEKVYFEQLRKTTPEIDQMVVEHAMFLHQMDLYSSRIRFKNSLNNIHQKLIMQGDIDEGDKISSKGRIIRFYRKYKKVTAIAASVAGFIAIALSVITIYFSPVPKKEDFQFLSNKINVLEGKLNAEIGNKPSKLPEGATFKQGGTGFLIDGKGYIVTNAHVLNGSSFVNVVNNKSDVFKAKIVYTDAKKDIAILKITDSDFTPLKSLPYSIAKVSNVNLGEEVFTLGYPRNEITYSKGDISAKSGYNGDTLSFQIQMSANPGNSGGPLLNEDGEVVGILSTRETDAEGVSFAIKSKNIYKVIEQLKEEDSSFGRKIKLPSFSTVSRMSRTKQINKIQDCIFIVQAFNTK